MKSSSAFDDFVDLLDYPMFVVTARADGRMGGCLVGFATQASIDPPRFLVGLSRQNHTTSIARAATHLAVHVLLREDVPLAELFGGETVRRRDRAEIRHGDHVGHLLVPVTGSAANTGRRPVYFTDVKDLSPGHGA
ncbi:flavin reductase family protein [Mycolicibacterium sp. HS_4_1]